MFVKEEGRRKREEGRGKFGNGFCNGCNGFNGWNIFFSYCRVRQGG
ncbi:hypothetical protein IQ269_25170 [Tychonema sp. LEGE 07199]|nr:MULTISPECIES: hypothetical protein [unclassified Tychonema]MBE9124001.1 hypothetical protein [Tychonema sp. LEGE 07199]MBE9135296.1 hypothetical protein [Tychonema sp. LEGE 07196]